jgi:hypothetical protein
VAVTARKALVLCRHGTLEAAMKDDAKAITVDFIKW